MDSLYGGHQGSSFTIKASFASYEDMVEAFSQGANYTTCWYGDFCLIDTPNKNDPNNGKIYQRGLNYQDKTTGGSLFYGQIVGPSGGTPYFQLDTIDNVSKKSTETLEENTYRRYPLSQNADGTITTNWQYNADSGQWEDIGGNLKKDFKFGLNNKSLVPGKKSDGTFNDDIKYTWVNIRKDDNDADSWFYVGFEFPYTVIDFQNHSVSQYDDAGNIKEDATTIARTDDGAHPFWERWNIGIPKGIKGDTLRHLKVITPTTSDKNKIYASDAIKVDLKTGLASIGQPGYNGIDDDIASGRKIIVFEYYIYDKSINPSPVLIYLGDFNIIADVKVTDDGTLTVSYTHNDNSVFTKRIKWVNGVSLTTGNGSTGGHFTMNFNTGDKYETNLTWVKGIEIATNGDVTGVFAGRGDDGNLAADGRNRIGHIKWIDSVTLDKESGRFICNLNDGTISTDTTLTWVKGISINQNTGEIKFIKTTGEEVSSAKLKILTRATVSENGITTLFFNTGESITLKNTDGTSDYKIKAIKRIYMNSGVQTEKAIHALYNTGEEETVSDPINSIERIAVRPSDWHLFILFSDPSHRATYTSLDADGKDSNGITWVTNQVVQGFDASVPDSYGNNTCWRDYGSIKDQAGILIGFNVKKSEVEADGFTNETVTGYLKKHFPDGLTGDANQPGGISNNQKIITYQPEDEEKSDKEFYAFDYNTYQWYYLGKIADTGMRDVKMLSEGEINGEALKTLNVDGLLFRKMAVNVSDVAIPKYWDSTVSR